MAIPVGGYQMVDISDVTLGEEPITVKNAKNAEILRKTSKPVFFYGAKSGALTLATPAVLVTDTGTVDGKEYTIFCSQDIYIVTTNDDNITFTRMT